MKFIEIEADQKKIKENKRKGAETIRKTRQPKENKGNSMKLKENQGEVSSKGAIGALRADINGKGPLPAA